VREKCGIPIERGDKFANTIVISFPEIVEQMTAITAGKRNISD
jgi:hypothetical protein